MESVQEGCPSDLASHLVLAGINAGHLSESFLNSLDSSQSRRYVADFQSWLREYFPSHAFLGIQVLHASDAMQEAGIADGSGFSTETASYSRTGNSHCRDDNRKWFAWKKACGALHKCDFWDDEASLLRDIQEAVDTKATVLILERLG